MEGRGHGAAAWMAGIGGLVALGIVLAGRPGGEGSAPGCEVVAAGALPSAVSETSGLARSRRDPDLYWTHNDAGNAPELFALDPSGGLAGRVRVSGAANVDWEDLAAGTCPEGPCLYVADIGDNDGERASVTVYRVAEPEAGAAETAPAAPLRARYPGGARDAEGLFVIGGRPYVVTKGREGPITLYRYPLPLRPGGTVTLERVREVLPAPEAERDRVTGASASPDGRTVAIRSYRRLYLFPADELIAGAGTAPREFDLSGLGEPQGEAVALGDDGGVWLTTESEDGDAPPRWARLRCDPGG